MDLPRKHNIAIKAPTNTQQPYSRTKRGKTAFDYHNVNDGYSQRTLIEPNTFRGKEEDCTVDTNQIRKSILEMEGPHSPQVTQISGLDLNYSFTENRNCRGS